MTHPLQSDAAASLRPLGLTSGGVALKQLIHLLTPADAVVDEPAREDAAAVEGALHL